MNEQTKEQLEEMERERFESGQGYSKFQDLTYPEYKKLISREEEIRDNPIASSVSVDDVVSDLQRYGNEGSKLLIKTFFDKTREDSRRASCAGRHGQVVYLAVGNYGNDLELGLLSAHAPGTSGSGGWFDGNRRLHLARKRKHPKIIDPEKWIEGTEAHAYEVNGKKIEYYKGKDNDPVGLDILSMMIQSTKRELERAEEEAKTPEQIEEDKVKQEIRTFHNGMRRCIDASRISEIVKACEEYTVKDISKEIRRMIRKGLKENPESAVFYVQRLSNGGHAFCNFIGGRPYNT